MINRSLSLKGESRGHAVHWSPAQGRDRLRPRKSIGDDGCHVYATDCDEGLAKAAAEKLGGTAPRLEMKDSRSLRETAAKVPELSALVNSAGIYPSSPLLGIGSYTAARAATAVGSVRRGVRTEPPRGTPCRARDSP